MTNHRPAGLLLFAAMTLALLATVSTAAYAVDIEVLAGFDGAVKAAVWSPIAVKLVNPGGRTIEGVLEVRQDTPNRRAMPVCSAKVSLPGNSTKLYHVYTRRPEYGGNMKVALVRGSRIIASRELNVVAISTRDRMIVSLGDRSSKLAFMTGEKVPFVMNRKTAILSGPGYSPSSGQTDSTIQAAALSPSTLFDRPAAYQGVDVMIISDFGGVSPDPKALKAISMWVAGGGTLVVSTGPNFRSFQTEFFDDLLPVKITGAGSVAGLVLATTSPMASPAGPAAIATSSPKPGICTELQTTNGMPIYAERRYGAGRVVFLAFDYKASPFRDWNGQVAFWKNILMTTVPGATVDENLEWINNLGPRSRGGYTSSIAAMSLQDVVDQNPAIKTPSFNIIALYLLAYVVFLVPVNYMYLKKRRRMELAWVSTPAIVLLFTLGAYVIGYTIKGGKIEMGVATVIEGSTNARYARLISEASLFSPARRSYDVDINDPYAIGQCIPEEEKEQMPTAYLGEKTAIEGIDMAMWSAKTIESVSGVDLGGDFTCNLTLVGNAVQGTVTNNTSLDLTDCAIQFGGMQQELGSLPRGRTVRVDAKSSTHSSSTRSNPYASYAKDIKGKLQGVAGTVSTASNAPTLVGFAKRNAPYGLSGRRGSVIAQTCLIIRLDVSTGGVLVFSPNSISATMVKSQNAEPADSSSGGSPVPGMPSMIISPSGSFVTMYQLPVSGSIELTSLMPMHTTTYPYHGSGSPRVKYYLGTSTGGWDAVNGPSGSRVPNPGKYLQPGNRIMLKVESLDSDDVQTSVGISAMGKQK